VGDDPRWPRGLRRGIVDGEDDPLEEIAPVRMMNEDVNHREKETPAPPPIRTPKGG
jgi:hypothetical protein